MEDRINESLWIDRFSTMSWSQLLQVESTLAKVKMMKKGESEFFDLHISELGFSVRAYNTLFKACGFKKVKDLKKLDLEVLKQTKGCGRKMIAEIAEVCQRFNIETPNFYPI